MLQLHEKMLRHESNVLACFGDKSELEEMKHGPQGLWRIPKRRHRTESVWPEISRRKVEGSNIVLQESIKSREELDGGVRSIGMPGEREHSTDWLTRSLIAYTPQE